MLIEPLYKYIFNIQIFHSFAYFLGTTSGELLRRFIELVFYLIIMYMIISEFKKNKKREYKYLIVGFTALFLRQVFMCIILFNQVFSNDKFTRFGVFINFIDGYFEIIALLLLVSAFVFPAFKDKTIRFQNVVIKSFYFFTILSFCSYIVFRTILLDPVYISIVLDLIKITILLSPLFLISETDYRHIKHRKSISLAFYIYLLTPLSGFVSLLLYGRIDPRLYVVQHPLPFFSILLLIRTVYLTLVDKAFLNTQLRESEERFRHEKELNKLKDHFISIVSHELRTPITSMKLYLSLFRAGKFGAVDKRQDTAVKTISDETNRLSDLIDNLLTVNKIEANKIVLEKSQFNLNEIIDDIYINLAHSKDIEVANKIRKNFKVNADKKLMKQIYINLMNNAIKFSDKGSKIELSCGRKSKEWFLSVKDQGIGISKQEIPKLFNKFYQADNSLTRKNPGIGLGLAIVKNIVDLHNGRVEVISKLGKGTEFKVWVKDLDGLTQSPTKN
ncbi:MAG: HAMP domain-containing sensor histidine kinase [Nanoarchaeota archaeon]